MRPLPISREEFAHFFQKSRPPTGWPARIGVANSGGPDSTCLLFLIQRYIQDSRRNQTPSPECVHSFTVDHALQASSAAMAKQSSNIAASLRVPHHTAQISWGTPPFPPLPDASQSFEATARTVRYYLFRKWMEEQSISVLAMGHHADDQVETALMRLGRNSTELGGRGMLWCRRWGMGQKNDLEWAGYKGMSQWFIRPLLEVSKDRILATCEEQELSYVIDKTNFQPEITLRNALRAIISSQDKDKPPPEFHKLPPDTRASLKAINTALTAFPHLSVDLRSTPEQLRRAVKSIGVYAADIENQATAQLDLVRLPSPPGTFILSSRALQHITDPLLQRAMILRILRYISYHPWGSLHSQARRSKYSLEQMISRLWEPNVLSPLDSRRFSAGGGVLWTPVIMDFSKTKPNALGFGRIIELSAVSNRRVKVESGSVGWMGTRPPPPRPGKLPELKVEDALNIDITSALREGLKAWDGGKGAGPAIVEVLWDCRFLLRFNLSGMPKNVSEHLLDDTRQGPIIAIRWWTKYFYPKVVLSPTTGSLVPSPNEGCENVLHSNIDSHQSNMLMGLRSKVSISPGKPIIYKDGETGITPLISSDWIQTSWIRDLDPC